MPRCTICRRSASSSQRSKSMTSTGHIVLVGHSVGAMTILQYLQHHQSRHTHRITGVGLIVTAAVDVTRYGLARLLRFGLGAALLNTPSEM
jgi:predicted alpha/beta hydrolase family esterase